MDDVTFGRNGSYNETWRLKRYTTTTSGVAIPGRSLTSMNACFLTSDKIDFLQHYEDRVASPLSEI